MVRNQRECEQCPAAGLAVEVAEIRTIVERLDRELLGEGSGGRMAAHELRLGKLERWRSWIAGGLATVATLLGGAVTLAAAVLSRGKH